jgi:hypothetical protein
VAFPQPDAWTRDSADIRREHTKRLASPCSFFCSQGRSLCLAAEYFRDDRLAEDSRGGVAGKHRHKNQLALFGQLMAAFEYMLKDFVAKAIDSTSAFDDKVKSQEWLNITTERILAQRVVQASIGSTLIHPTLGWHSPETVNERFKSLFNVPAINGDEIRTLNVLWILRHSVAHNAGFVTAHDAARIGQHTLSEQVAHIDAPFISESFDFLKLIAERLATNTGKSILKRWFVSVKEYGKDWQRDKEVYVRVKHLGLCVVPRTHELTDITVAAYNADWALHAT